ncbi:DNA-directed DNA polymerase [Ranunculus cassubicifolius]
MLNFARAFFYTCIFLHNRRDHHSIWITNGCPFSSTSIYNISNTFYRISKRTYIAEDSGPKTDRTGYFHPRDQILCVSSSSARMRPSRSTSCSDQNIMYAPSPPSIHDEVDYVGNYTWNQETKKIHEMKVQNRKIEPHLENNSSHLVMQENSIALRSNVGSKGIPDGSYYIKEGTFRSPLNRVNAKGNRPSEKYYQSEVQARNFGETKTIIDCGDARSLPHHQIDIYHGFDEDTCNSSYFSINDVKGARGDSVGQIERSLEQDVMRGIQLKSSKVSLGAKLDITAGKSDEIPVKSKSKSTDQRENLGDIYDEVVVINNISAAKEIVRLLTTEYRDLVHACDTEVANIDVKKETPVNHGEIICFSIYSGPGADFGNGKKCIWVDVLDGGGRNLLMEFAPFFEDSSIKKVWHNYSFDSHVIENYGIKLSGFYADTMHMARLWNSSRRTEGGYSLEALTSDVRVMNGVNCSLNKDLLGKVSMKTIFGKKKLKKDGNEGKITNIAPVEELQRKERKLWICYSALDSMSTLQLFESLESKLKKMNWVLDGKTEGSMYNFYEKYWRPFGELLVNMETEGMLVDREYLAQIQEVATREQKIAGDRFRNWAASYCPDAVDMNVGSDAQLRQLFFGGTLNSKDQNVTLPESRTFKVLNVEKVIEEGKKAPTKYRNITLSKVGNRIETEMYTASGWPSVSGDALKALAGKVSSEYDWSDPLSCADEDDLIDQDVDISPYGTAYKAFGGNTKGKEACHAVAALCDVCSIDSLISNFILPLQSNHISGRNERIHCSLNINTETGRLSARRPNLQNQPALEKDRYKIRQAFIAAPGNSLVVADYGQLELRILAHLANCKSMKDAFKAGGDFHSRTAMNMYPHIKEAVENKQVLLEWHPQPGEDKPPVPLLKDAFGSERRKAKMLNFSIAYGKTPVGLARDWKVSVKEAKETVNLWYSDRKEVLIWQEARKREANIDKRVRTLLGRSRHFPSMSGASNAHKNHIERAAINTPVQGSAADVAMCAMLQISKNARLKELGWKLLLQVHDEVILEGPIESQEEAKSIVVDCMSKPFDGVNILTVDLAVDAKCAQNWYAAK